MLFFRNNRAARDVYLRAKAFMITPSRYNPAIPTEFGKRELLSQRLNN